MRLVVFTLVGAILAPLGAGLQHGGAPKDSSWERAVSNLNGISAPFAQAPATSFSRRSDCAKPPETLDLTDPPYSDYFYSDCHSASQVVVTSPLRTSNLSLIGPRLLVAWPAGNSGLVAFFKPSNGINGTLAVKLQRLPQKGTFLTSYYKSAAKNALRNDPMVGVTGVIHFNSSAVLNLPILGSIRTMRDFTEGPSIIYPEIQRANTFARLNGYGASISRVWLDNITTTQLTFVPVAGARAVKIQGRTLSFGAGNYRFSARFNYPQLTQLDVSAVLNPASQGLIKTEPARTKALAFLSYEGKLLAGAWRFLTYFGRDSMIAMLLLQPVLSTGKGGAIESVIGAVLERIQRSTGTVCHEETIGDYATYLNMQENKTSTKPICNYVMVDTDYYLPVAMNNYFVLTSNGRKRSRAFLNTPATLNFGNRGLKYSYLARLTAERIMNHAAKFAAKGGQTKANLRHLMPDQIVGEWRDSTYGLGGGRIPYDVNTALVPAALRAIASLSHAGFFPSHPGWSRLATEYAQVWEDKTLEFFAVTVPQAQAKSLVKSYVRESGFKGPDQTSTITEDVEYHAVAINGNNGQRQVKVMNSDTAFRLFLLNTTNDLQLTSLLKSTAAQILRPFPVGLSTDVGILVANPAFGGAPVYARNFTTADYHGTVIWGWPMAMLAKGLEHQLGRCGPAPSADRKRQGTFVPAFCNNKAVYGMVRKAYNRLWNLIEKNRPLLSAEVWSWVYDQKAGKFTEVDLGTLSATESNIRQLWSLTFLAVKRNEAFR